MRAHQRISLSFSLAFVVAILLLIPRANAGDAGKYAGETFVIYSYGGVWDEAVKAGAVNRMQEKYPKLEIIIDPSGGFTKLLAEKDDPQADVSFIDDSTMAQAMALGIAQPLDFSKIPAVADVYEQGKLFGNYGVAIEFGRMGICYRADKIDQPPTSWNDLWNPTYVKHIAIGAPTAGGTAWVQFLVAAARLKGGDWDNIEPGFQKLKELKPNLLTITETTAQVTQLFTDGDLWIGHFWDGRCISLARTGVPVKFVSPKEGAFATITYVAMIKGTKHPELAHEFIQHMLSKDGQIAFGRLIGYGPTNSKVQIDQKFIEEGVLFGSEQVKAMQILPWDKIIPKRAGWLETWNAIMR